jgi:ABC-type sugar transport system substrate-binding protein
MAVPNADTAVFKEMLTGARQEARRQGARLVVTYTGDAEGFIQARRVIRLLDQGVDALVIDAGVRVTEEVADADVPVVSVGNSTSHPAATAFVMSESVVAGRLAAEYLFFRMGGTGTAAVILPPEFGPADLVQRGFEEIVDRTPTVTLAVQRAAEVDVNRAASIASEVFESDPDVEGVFAGTDEIALGVVQAARRLGILGRVAIVGVGGTAPALAAIEAGRLEGSVRTDAEELGRLAVDAAVRAARDEPVPRRQVVDVTLVTRENVKRFLP